MCGFAKNLQFRSYSVIHKAYFHPTYMYVLSFGEVKDTFMTSCVVSRTQEVKSYAFFSRV